MGLYDLSNALQRESFKKRVNRLYERQALVELSEPKMKTQRQNAYLHVALTYLAGEYGAPLTYVKQVLYKQRWNADIFERELTDPQTGETETWYRSTADLTKEEMSLSIDRLIRFAAEGDIFIPAPDDDERVELMKREALKYERFV